MTSQDLHDLAHRYGAPAPWRRRLIWALALVVVLGAATWVVWALVGYSSPTVKSRLVSFEVVDQHTVSARVQLEVDDDAEDVSCLLRALSEDKATVGEVAFTAEPGDTTLVEQIRTERRATAVEFLGCTAEGQPRYH